MTLRQIIQEVARLDPNLRPDESTFHSAVLLLAALQQGQDTMKLAQFTGYSLAWIEERAARLRAAGIWKRGKTHAEWADDEDGAVSFWMDVCVAEGLLKRAAGVWKRSGKKLMKGAE